MSLEPVFFFLSCFCFRGLWEDLLNLASVVKRIVLMISLNYSLCWSDRAMIVTSEPIGSCECII